MLPYLSGMPYIIGIAGKKGSGKSTFATTLVQYLNQQNGLFTTGVFSLAEPLKNACMHLFFGEHRNYFGQEADKNGISSYNGKTYREVMQDFGTILRISYDKRFWLWNIEQRIIKSGTGIAIVDDVRYDNEAEWIHENGGMVINLVRVRETEVIDKHDSERGVSQSLVTNNYRLYTRIDTNIYANEAANKAIAVISRK